MIVYISGPITKLIKAGKDYREKFEEAQKELEAQGHTVLNPAMLPKGLRPVSYMTICMALIDAADALYILPTYDGVNSKGTELEIDYARYQQKKIMHKAASSRK